MITFRIKKNTVIASYTTRSNTIDWLVKKFDEDEKYDFHRTFTFGKEDLVKEIPKTPKKEEAVFTFSDVEIEPIDFVFATLEKEYFKVKKGVLSNKLDIYLHIDIEITTELFLV